MGMSEGGRERENTGSTSSQEKVATEKIGSEETGSELSEGQTMSTDCASPIGRSSHSLQSFAVRFRISTDIACRSIFIKDHS